MNANRSFAGLGAILAVTLWGCGQPKAPVAKAVPPVALKPKPKPAAPPPKAAAPSSTPSPKPESAAPWKRWNPSQSTSVGSVLSGQLKGGVQLPARAPGILHNPGKDRKRAYGTVEVVSAIIRAGKTLAKRPETEHIVINDLSFAQGGPIDGHASHRAGRDFDFYFPLHTRNKKPFPGKLIPLNRNGVGFDYRKLDDPTDDIEVHIDLERTWDFLSALLEDEQAPVQVIYLVAHLQSALAKHARARGVPHARIAHFLQHSCQPKGAPHDDHGHIRFYCSAEDIRAGCQDNAPIDAAQRARLQKAGVAPVIAKPKPRAARKVRTTSAKQARKKAGKLHSSVAAFLDARREWTRKIPRGPARCR